MNSNEGSHRAIQYCSQFHGYADGNTQAYVTRAFQAGWYQCLEMMREVPKKKSPRRKAAVDPTASGG